MISRTLSTSARWAALHKQAGKLAEFCQSLYPLLVAHSDDWGRQQGDPFTVKVAINPTSPRKLPDFERALLALHEVGLIDWYEVEGRQYIQVRNWDAHQDLHKRSEKQKFPEPPGDSGESRGIPFELKGTEGNRTEPTRRAATPPSGQRDEDEKLGTGAFIRKFCELFAKHRDGARYHFVGAKHTGVVRSLLRTHGAERLEKLAVIMLTSTADEFINGSDRGIGVLNAKVNWCEALLAEHETRKGLRVVS